MLALLAANGTAVCRSVRFTLVTASDISTAMLVCASDIEMVDASIDSVASSEPLGSAETVALSLSSSETAVSLAAAASVSEDTASGLSRDADNSSDVVVEPMTPERIDTSSEFVCTKSSVTERVFDGAVCVSADTSSTIEADAVCLTTDAAPERSGSSEVMAESDERSEPAATLLTDGSSTVSDTSAVPNADVPGADGVLSSTETVWSAASCKSVLTPVALALMAAPSVDVDISTDNPDAACPTERIDCSATDDISFVVVEREVALIL
jgi:hypothetical protein